MSSQAEEAVASGLADTIDEEPEHVHPDDVSVVDVDTSGERDDDGIAADAEVVDLPVELEPASPIAPGVSLVPVRDELKGLTELAVTLAIADNTPYALKGKPAAVLAVFLTGRELGIPPMTALRNLHVIDGKVTVNPKVRAAMVRREGLGKLWPHQGPREIACPLLVNKKHNDSCPQCAGLGRVVRLCECGRNEPDNDDEMATWHAKRADDPFIIYSSTYTMGMARGVKVKNGTLADKDNWQHYPERMLSWRSLGYLLDDAFPEVGTGLYSPDELGAITDEEGEPVIDVGSTEVLTERASRDRTARSGGTARPPSDPPASPDTIATFKARIEKIKRYQGAPEALKALWQADDGHGQPKLPPVDALMYRHCKMAAAMLDSIEKRITKGDFGEEVTDADIVDDGTHEEVSTGHVPPQEGLDDEREADPEADPDSDDNDLTGTGLWFDPNALLQGRTPGDDLTWCEAAGEAMVTEVAAEVTKIPADELTAVMKALDLSANGLSEATKRARITARRVRLKLERLAGL